MTKPKRRTVQPDDVVKMNELYLTIGTYAGVGREVGFTGGTVKRYIIQGYVPKTDMEPIEKIEFEIPSMRELEYPQNWEAFLQLTKEELEDVRTLQKTISL